AMLHLLGRRVNRGRIPVPWADTSPTPDPNGFWHRFSRGVMARPVVSFVGAASLLLILTIPAFSLITANYSVRQLPPDQPVVRGTGVLTRNVTGPGQGRQGALVVVAHPRTGVTSTVVSQAHELAARIGRDPAVIGSAVAVDRLGRAALQIT